MTDLAFLFDNWTAGGWVLVAIFCVSAIAWSLLIAQWFKLRSEQANAGEWTEQAFHELEQGNHAHARSLTERHDALASRAITATLDSSGDRRFVRACVEPLVTSAAADLRRLLDPIAVLCSVLPLLGLLGTVLGMLKTFSAMSAAEAARMPSVADGVSQALLTTQAGLVAALPILVAHQWLASRIDASIDHAMCCSKRASSIVCEGS